MPLITPKMKEQLVPFWNLIFLPRFTIENKHKKLCLPNSDLENSTFIFFFCFLKVWAYIFYYLLFYDGWELISKSFQGESKEEVLLAMSKTLLFPVQRGSLKYFEFQETDKIKMSPELTRGTRIRFVFPNSACDLSFHLSRVVRFSLWAA